MGRWAWSNGPVECAISARLRGLREFDVLGDGVGGGGPVKSLAAGPETCGGRCRR
jgi:hypothetical protein